MRDSIARAREKLLARRGCTASSSSSTFPFSRVGKRRAPTCPSRLLRRDLQPGSRELILGSEVPARRVNNGDGKKISRIRARILADTRAWVIDMRGIPVGAPAHRRSFVGQRARETIIQRVARVTCAVSFSRSRGTNTRLTIITQPELRAK